MRRPWIRSILAFILASACPTATVGWAQSEQTGAIAMQSDMRWRFFTDQVMGGVSTGQVEALREGSQPFMRLSGSVSTANRGGFIQMRVDLAEAPPASAVGLRLMVRGNDQRYFVHLRTGGTFLPWQYYQSGFDVTRSWREVRLPFSGFEASSPLLRGEPRPSALRSVAVVAYGRDHEAQVDVRDVGFY